jgi:hypothetical protein
MQVSQVGQVNIQAVMQSSEEAPGSLRSYGHAHLPLTAP